MSKKFIIEKNESGLTIIKKTSNISIQDLYHEVVSLFEDSGLILFRDFNINPEKITEITNRYTEKYSGEALRRSSHYGQKVVHGVDTGGMGKGDEDIGGPAVDFHSESSFTPTMPEVIWFYCNLPPQKGGKTILCDGIKLWKDLSTKTKSFFFS